MRAGDRECLHGRLRHKAADLYANTSSSLLSVVAEAPGDEASPFDLCFIDADHAYAHARSDLQRALASGCRLIMMHDVAQSTGVRPLWHQLAQRTRRSGKEAHECLQQPALTTDQQREAFEKFWKRAPHCTNAIIAEAPDKANIPDATFKARCKWPSGTWLTRRHGDGHPGIATVSQRQDRELVKPNSDHRDARLYMRSVCSQCAFLV